MLLLFLLISASYAFLPLGTITHSTAITCPSGFYSGMSCKALTVSCSNTLDLVVNIGVLLPSGTSVGTVTLTDGSGGTSIFDNGYVAIYSAASLKVVQIQ